MNLARELKVFFVHLRWHYQVFILSGGFLLGGVFVPRTERFTWRLFIAEFLVVHLLLNGGVTAYNSFFDDDDGPIGGLESPPKMKPWMHPASIAVQALGLPLALRAGLTFCGLYLLTMVLSVLYSSSRFRFKAHPWKSVFCVGVGTGTNTFLMGYLAGGGDPGSPWIYGTAVGVAALLLSMYPVSQVFQIEDDRARGDTGFAVTYGLDGVRRFYRLAYLAGGLVVCGTLFRIHGSVGLVFGGLTALGGILNDRVISRLTGTRADYRPIMRLKYGASLMFVFLLVFCLWWLHGPHALPA